MLTVDHALEAGLIGLDLAECLTKRSYRLWYVVISSDNRSITFFGYHLLVKF